MTSDARRAADIESAVRKINQLAAADIGRVFGMRADEELASILSELLTARVEWLELVAWGLTTGKIKSYYLDGFVALTDDDDDFEGAEITCDFDANGIPLFHPELHAALKEARGG